MNQKEAGSAGRTAGNMQHRSQHSYPVRQTLAILGLLLTLASPSIVRADLVCSSSSANSVTLSWTAPADAGYTTAERYEIRYSTSPLTEQNWTSASIAPNAPTPLPAGQEQTLVVSGLNASTNYYFAIKSADSSLNWSPLSSVVSRSTIASDASLPPDRITDLVVSHGVNGIVLQWTAPANSAGGAVSGYFVQYSRDSITAASLASAGRLIVRQAPKAPGQSEQLTVQSLADTAKFYFVVRSRNGNFVWSSLSNQVATDAVEPVSLPGNTFAYPNPFRFSQTPRVTFTLVPPRSSLMIMTVDGEPVKRWTNNSGADISWDGTNESGHIVSPGTFLWYVEGTGMNGKLIVIR